MREERDSSPEVCLRIAAAGDIHCSEARRSEIRRSLGTLNGLADLVLQAEATLQQSESLKSPADSVNAYACDSSVAGRGSLAPHPQRWLRAYPVR